MPLQQYPSTEPLYIITYLVDDAPSHLRAWHSKTKTHAKVIDTNKLHLYTSNSLQHFFITWPHSLEKIKIWDNWNRKHIRLD
jgi:hypothetical protein